MTTVHAYRVMLGYLMLTSFRTSVAITACVLVALLQLFRPISLHNRVSILVVGNFNLRNE